MKFSYISHAQLQAKIHYAQTKLGQDNSHEAVAAVIERAITSEELVPVTLEGELCYIQKSYSPKDVADILYEKGPLTRTEIAAELEIPEKMVDCCIYVGNHCGPPLFSYADGRFFLEDASILDEKPDPWTRDGYYPQ